MNPQRKPGTNRTIKSKAWWSRSSLLCRYGIAVGAVTLATLLTLLFWPLIQINFFPPFTAAVVVSVWVGGLGPGLVATALAVLANMFLFLPPFYSLAVTADGLLEVGFFLALALGVTILVDLFQRTETALHESEARYRALADLCPDAILVNANGYYAYANAAAARLLGLVDAREIVGRSPFEFIESTYHALARERVRLALEEQRVVPLIEYRWKRQDGTPVDVEVAAGPILWESDRAVQVVVRDISVRKEAEAAQQRLARQLLAVQEHERRHLARELHDEVMQTLTALQINLDLLAKNQPTPSENLTAGMALVDDLVDQVRTLSLELRPTVLDELGLAAALEWYCREQAPRLGLQAQYAIDPRLPRPSPEVETTCFRVVQEAMTNVARHAQTQKVWITLRQHAKELHLIVHDAGVGFDVEASRKGAMASVGLGLRGMEERVQLVEGRLDIRSAPGRGTEIHVWAPLIPSALQ